MKNLLFAISILFISVLGYSQTDTISNNIYQKNGNLGIGTSNPLNILEIRLGSTGSLYEKGFEITRNNGFLRFINGTEFSGEFQPRISGMADSEFSPGLTLAGTPSFINENARGILLRAGEYYPMQSGNVLEVDNYTTTLMSVNTNGDMGVGINKPLARVHVHDGDIYIDNIKKGIIMKSPNGDCWRGVLDNTGNLTFSRVNCPETAVVNALEQEPLNELLIFPNPTSKTVSIAIENCSLKKVNYTICDINGRLMLQGKLNINGNEIDISSLADGVYIMKVIDKQGNFIASNKIIKR